MKIQFIDKNNIKDKPLIEVQKKRYGQKAHEKMSASLIIIKMQIKAIITLPHTHLDDHYFKKLTSFEKNVEKLEPCVLLVGM